MIVYFLGGVFSGILLLSSFYFASYKKRVSLEASKQKIQEEKRIIVNFIHNLSEAIQANISRTALFELILHTATISTGASSACLYECREDDLISVAIEGLFPPQSAGSRRLHFSKHSQTSFIKELLSTEVLTLNDGLIPKVAKTGEALFIPEAHKVKGIHQSSEPLLKIRSIMIVPIKIKNKVLGLIVVCNPVQYPAFKRIDFSLVQSLADQAAMAINQLDLVALQVEKNKIDFDLSLAKNIQSMLLPKSIPSHKSLDIDIYYEAAQTVGGDLYDMFYLDEDTIGCVIADVSGKGIPASIVMAICQTNFRQYARRYDSPAEVLKAMNATMLSSIGQDMFITMVYGIVNLKAHTLTLARAGHEKPLLIKHNLSGAPPEILHLSSPGMALGIVKPEIFDTVIQDYTLPFEKQDTLILYTDGLTEVFNPQGEQFSSQALVTILKQHHEETPRHMNGAILRHLHYYCGSKQFPDDLTLVTLKHV